jgi:hypothetical protein
MKTSKEKLLREKMGKYVIKLLGLNLKKERKLYERFQFPKPMVIYML